MNDNMKPSCIDYIGNIPENWSVKRIKFVIDNIKDGTHGTFERVESGEMLLSAKNVFDDRLVINDNESEISYQDYLSIVANGYPKKGDLLLCCVGTIGRTCVYSFDRPLAFQRSVAFLRPNSKTNPKYLKYCMQSDSTLVQEQLLINKSAQDGLYMGSIKELIIAYTDSIHEQTLIADYLDEQCGKIDDIVKNIENQIEILKKYKISIITEMTYSNNSDWIRTKFKYFGEIRGRIGFRGYTVEDTVDPDTEGCAVVLGGTNIMRDGSTNYENLTFLSEMKYFESPEIKLTGGEILITKVGAGTGENAMYDGRFERATINPNVMLFIPNDNINPEFINYTLLSKRIKDDMKVESTKSGAQPAINQGYINNLVVNIPPYEVQTQVADYLNKQCVKINSIIMSKNEQLHKISQKKKSLIYEYVTGKKRVKGVKHIGN